MDEPVRPQPSVKRRVAVGAAWMIAMRWAMRLSGVASTVLLARLLTSADYGVVAIATLILGTVEILGETGQANALVRLPKPTREYYDSAWTISLMMGFGLSLIVLAATPLTTAYFHEPRAQPVLMVLALRTALSGFQNVAIVNFQREFNFHKQFQMNLGATLVQLVAGIVSAFVLRNYWALVIGIMSKQAASIVLGYVLEPYWPRLSWAKIPELFSFSFWLLFRNIGNFVSGEVDKIAIGGFAGAAAMGRYEIGRDIAISPVSEVVLPLVYVLYPGLAKVQADKEKRRELFLSVLHWSALICASTAVGVSLVATDMTDLILGPQWDAVKPLIPWLALSAGVWGLTLGVYNAFEALGRADLSARLIWFRVSILALAIFPVAIYFQDLEAVAITRFWVTLAISPPLFYALGKALDVPVTDFALVLWRPFLSGFAMAVAVLALNAALPFTGPPRLILDIVVGAASFTIALMILWVTTGRPEGPEGLVWVMLCKWFATPIDWWKSARRRT